MVSRIVVKTASEADRTRLIEFVRDHWSSTHVFVDAPEVFDWQYLQADGRLNMVFAEDPDAESENRVLGVLGFIPLGRFDRKLGDDDILLALWKVREGEVPPGLGLKLLKFIQAEYKPRLIGAIGISDVVGPIYKALGYTVDRLNHAAIFASSVNGDVKMAAGVPQSVFEASVDVAEHKILPLDPENRKDREVVNQLGACQLPVKSWVYVKERYLSHPWYSYSLRRVEKGGDTVAIVAWREVEAQGARILRIVDIIGGTDWLSEGVALLSAEVQTAGAEYIDLMQYGTPDEVMKQGGWVSPDWIDGLILPNYFAPFARKNINIALSYKVFDPSAKKSVRLYRSDSDQDRPNRACDINIGG